MLIIGAIGLVAGPSVPGIYYKYFGPKHSLAVTILHLGLKYADHEGGYAGAVSFMNAGRDDLSIDPDDFVVAIPYELTHVPKNGTATWVERKEFRQVVPDTGVSFVLRPGEVKTLHSKGVEMPMFSVYLAAAKATAAKDGDIVSYRMLPEGATARYQYVALAPNGTKIRRAMRLDVTHGGEEVSLRRPQTRTENFERLETDYAVDDDFVSVYEMFSR